MKVFSIGVPPSSDGNPLTWAEKSLLEPMPIKYSVISISEIFTNRFFDLKSLKAEGVKIDIPKFAKNLEKSFKAYCNDYLLPRGRSLFCTEEQFTKLLSKTAQANAFKIQDGSLIRIRNVYKDKCITYAGNRVVLQLKPCSNDNNQVFKLIFVSSINAYRVVTNGPLSNGQWDYISRENRLGIWDYGDDVLSHRHYTFTNKKDNIYQIKSLSTPADKCFQAIQSLDMVHMEGGCQQVYADFIITPA